MRSFTHIFLLFAFACCSLPTQAQSSGIRFFQGSWEEVLAEAEAQRKLIFIDAYATWCGPCKMMDRNTFPNEKVGEFFNEHFVSYKIDMEKGEGPALADRYNVKGYPTLLFVNYKGEQVHRAEGYKSPRELLAQGKAALDPAKNKTTLELRYEAGTNDPATLFDYAMTLYQMGEPYEEVAQKYFATQPDKALTSGTNWEAIRAFTHKIDSREFQCLLAKQKKFAKLYGKEAVQNKIIEVVELNTEQAAAIPDPGLYQKAMKIALEEIDDDGFTASRLRMKYAALTQNWQEYAHKASILFDTYSITDPKVLNEAAWNFYLHVDDPALLQKALSWARQSTAIDNAYYNHRTFTYLLYKTENYEEALKLAYKTRRMAEFEGEEAYMEMGELLQKIKQATQNR